MADHTYTPQEVITQINHLDGILDRHMGDDPQYRLSEVALVIVYRVCHHWNRIAKEFANA